MGLDLDDRLPGNAADLLEALRPIVRKGKQEVHDAVPSRQNGVQQRPVRAIAGPLLSTSKIKISPRERSLWQKMLKHDVRAEVHVMVAVDAVRSGAIEAAKFIELRRYHIFERPHEPGVKDDLRKAVPPQVSAQSQLMFGEPGGYRRTGEWRREIQVQADIDATLKGNCRGAI
jgi:hypothetical protein